MADRLQVVRALLQRIKHLEGECWQLMKVDGEPLSEKTVPNTSIDGVPISVRQLFMEHAGQVRTEENTFAVRHSNCTYRWCVNPAHFHFGRPTGNGTRGLRRAAGAKQGRPPGVEETKPRKPRGAFFRNGVLVNTVVTRRAERERARREAR